ncbi:fibroin heavy chain [Galendromus occidentalis]|uniref:Fibroin heavy chain n=1 Tax=Galendromus occidentalis TaxID=34638 RepID=A0AAJ7WJG3_9ACAR|nr:fibroin heavy chain [Galendromus occidentalis]
MRTFQVLFAAFGVAAVRSQLITSSRGISYGSGLGSSYGSGFGSSYGTLLGGGGGYGTVLGGGSGYGTVLGGGLSSLGGYATSVPASVSVARTISAGPAVSYAAAPIATRVATVAAPAYSTISAAPAYSTISAAPAYSTISAAPAYSTISAAPAISTVGVSAAPVNVGVISAGGAATVRSHEIHTGSGNQAIRIEDFQAGDQVIRVHEGPQEGPQVAQVQVPGEQHHVRVINHGSGRAQVERVVGRAPTQVIDVQKPGRPGARIVQVVKGQSPPPAIEFVQDGGSSHEVYYADDVGAGGAIGGGLVGGGTIGGGLVGGGVIRSGVIGGGLVGGGLIGGGVRTVSAPAITVARSAPAITVARAAPAISYGTGTGISYGTGLGYGSGISYGSGLGYGSGISYGTGLGSVRYTSGYGSGLGGVTYGGGLGYGLGQSTYGLGYGSPAIVSSYAKKASAAASKAKSSRLISQTQQGGVISVFAERVTPSAEGKEPTLWKQTAVIEYNRSAINTTTEWRNAAPVLCQVMKVVSLLAASSLVVLTSSQTVNRIPTTYLNGGSFQQQPALPAAQLFHSYLQGAGVPTYTQSLQPIQLLHQSIAPISDGSQRGLFLAPNQLIPISRQALVSEPGELRQSQERTQVFAFQTDPYNQIRLLHRDEPPRIEQVSIKDPRVNVFHVEKPVQPAPTILQVNDCDASVGFGLLVYHLLSIMRAFQVLAVTLVATAARGQIISGYGSNLGGFGIGGLSYGSSYAPSVSYATPVSGYAAVRSPASVGYSTGSVISAAPTVSVAAAPAISVAAAPAVSLGGYGGYGGYGAGYGSGISYGTGIGSGVSYGGGIGGGAIVTGNGGGIRSHEIHTGGAGNAIRIEEIKAGGQLIRVHDGQRLGTEVLNVQGPAAAGNHIRLISRTGPTQVQRSVVQDPNVQVFDVVNPVQPGDRIINIRKAPAPPAQVELVAEQHHGVPEIHVGGDEANIQVQHVGGGLGGGLTSTAVLGAVGGGIAAAPVASYAVSAPAVQTFAAAPAVSYSSGVRTIAAPAVSYGTGLSYGLGGSGLSYGLGGYGSSYGLGGYGSSYGLGGYGSSYGLGGYGSSYGLGGYGLNYGLGGNSYGTTIVGKKAKKILGVALVASSASAVHNTYSTISSSSYGLAAPVSYGYAAAAPVAYAAAPVAYAAAAAPVSYSVAAPAVVSAPAASAAVVSAPAPSVRSHEIHTGGAGNSIRVEEHRAAGQVIRVHDAPQAPTRVINVQGPAAPANHIRLISRDGPTQVQRQVFQNPNAQVYDVVNPARPGDQIINIRGAPAPPARVELVAEQQHAAPEIHVGGNDVPTQVVRAGPAAVAAPAAISYAAPAAISTYAAPAAITSYAAPAAISTYAAPAYSTYAAPAYSAYAAPGLTTYGLGYAHSGTYGSTAVLHKA